MAMALRRTDLLEDPGLRGRSFAEAWTDRIESWLVELFDEAGGNEGGFALVAVGGQGRREMAPQSDLDLLLLHDPATAPTEVAEMLWYPIWDTGLKLGHAVRSVRDTLALAAEDLETATALLSARHLCGDPELTTELAERSRSAWRKKGRRWLGELSRATRERHAEAGEVAFSLEPDLKEGRGGLRDVHVLGWAAAAGAPIDEHLSGGLVEEHDALLDVRVELHRIQGRAGDRLLLQEQDAIAAKLGDVDADALMARVAAAGGEIAFVSDEAWHDIDNSLDDTFFGRLRRSRTSEPGLEVSDGRVSLVDELNPVNDPFEVLRVANLAARDRLRVSATTLDALATAPAPPDPWPPTARDSFCELLLSGPAAVTVIEMLERHGLWTRLLPEWAPTVRRLQRNAYHRFTVDRHLLETVAEAAGLSNLVPRPDLLVMGALLHDIGKGYPELGDHSVCGARMAHDIADRMGFSEEDASTVESLVRHHLLLPDVATRRDLSDPATLEFVAGEAGTIERVSLLRALTEADSLATGPSAWSPWKAGLLDTLAARTIEVIEGGAESHGAKEDFPTPRQLELLERGGTGLIAEGDRITVVTEDRPGVFFRVAGALAIHGLDVVEARIHSEGDHVLDEFTVRAGPTGMVPWDRVGDDVVRVLEGRLALQVRVEERAKSHTRRQHGEVHQFAPSVKFDNGGSAAGSVVEVVGPNSIGLLYRLARALSEFNLNITGARIHTMGPDVVDAFYVSLPDGGRLEDEDLQSEVRRSLLNALDHWG